MDLPMIYHGLPQHIISQMPRMHGLFIRWKNGHIQGEMAG